MEGLWDALEEFWAGILELTSQLVIPDWGALIALLPVIVTIPILVILVITFRRLLSAPGPSRGKARIVPRTPDGIHMPGPSKSPFLVALGAALMVLGLVFGGVVLVLGAIALGLTLLYWLAEALRIYDHDIGATAPGLPAVIHDGPPEGVHMPGPSFRPFLGALGTAMLMVGLVFGGWLLIVGVIALVVTLVGWLFDARREYVKTVEADQTGHLENIPAPHAPTAMLAVLAILFVGGVALQAGWLPPGQASGGDPSASPGASGEPAPSGGPEPSDGAPPPPAADVTITASQIAFVETSFTAPADAAFTIALDNQDDGIDHNVELKDGAGTSVFQGDLFPGVATEVYEVPALPAGDYTFVCTLHANMTGTATLQ